MLPAARFPRRRRATEMLYATRACGWERPEPPQQGRLDFSGGRIPFQNCDRGEKLEAESPQKEPQV